MFKKVITLILTLSISLSYASYESGGYLPESEVVNTTSIIGPPPSNTSIAFLNDKAISEATFSLDKNSQEYIKAIHDASNDSNIHIADFSKAFGQKLSKEDTPAIYNLLQKAIVDANNAKNIDKDYYKRKRPFVFFDKSPCDLSEDPSSYSYPSGHTTRAWTYGLILAELKPQNAIEILKVANGKGQSRVICGVHWQSDIEAAKMVATINFTILQTNEQFRKDFKNAQKEISKK